MTIQDTDYEDVGEMWRSWKEHLRGKRKQNLQKADPRGWTKHTDYHWSRTVNGKRLDYWPSRNKFQYAGRVMCGDVMGFIRNKEKQNEKA